MTEVAQYCQRTKYSTSFEPVTSLKIIAYPMRMLRLIIVTVTVGYGRSIHYLLYVVPYKLVVTMVTCPQARPMPLSPIPCGQDRFNSRASAPAS